MYNHSYENEFNLHVNEISFSYERMSTKTRFEKEAKGNSEMAYYAQRAHPAAQMVSVEYGVCYSHQARIISILVTDGRTTDT